MTQIIAKLAISWGLVVIPVTVHAAIARHPVPLHQVHTQCGGGRIRLRRFCEREGVEVPYQQVASGFEADDGRVVVLSDADLADLPLPTSPKAIEVLAFVPEAQLNPLLLHRPYYLGIAEAAAARPYALLRDVMSESGLVGIVRLTLRTRESLAVLRVRGETIALQLLLWADELRAPDDVPVPHAPPPHRQEREMARSLMNVVGEDFHLEEQHDAYRHALEQVVAARLEGLEPPHAPATQPADTAADLMAALEHSVRAASRRRTGASAGKKARPKKDPGAAPPAGTTR